MKRIHSLPSYGGSSDERNLASMPKDVKVKFSPEDLKRAKASARQDTLLEIDHKKKKVDQRTGTIHAWQTNGVYIGNFKTHEKAFQNGGCYTRVGANGPMFNLSVIVNKAAVEDPNFDVEESEDEASEVDIEKVFADLRAVCARHRVSLNSAGGCAVTCEETKQTITAFSFANANGDNRR